MNKRSTTFFMFYQVCELMGVDVTKIVYWIASVSDCWQYLRKSYEESLSMWIPSAISACFPSYLQQPVSSMIFPSNVSLKVEKLHKKLWKGGVYFGIYNYGAVPWHSPKRSCWPSVSKKKRNSTIKGSVESHTGYNSFYHLSIPQRYKSSQGILII